MSLQNVKRGDLIVVKTFGWRRSDPPTVRELVVVSVGSKYVTVQPANEKLRFERETGKHVSDYLHRHHAYASMAEYEAEQRRDDLLERARCDTWRLRSLSDDDLAALVAILERAK